jgi:hypothetical protein
MNLDFQIENVFWEFLGGLLAFPHIFHSSQKNAFVFLNHVVLDLILNSFPLFCVIKAKIMTFTNTLNQGLDIIIFKKK